MNEWFDGIPSDWSIKNLGETIAVLTDYTANGSFESLKANVTYYSEPNYAVLVRTTDLGKPHFSPERYTDERGYNFQRKTALFGGEIVLANVGSVGKVYRVPYYNMPMTLAPNTYLVKCNDTVDQGFVYQFLKSDFYLRGLFRNINSTTLSAINKDNFRSIPIALPETKKEQSAVREVLEKADEVISKTEALIEKYQQIKAGLMYDLFTRGVAADGKLRPTREQAPELYQETPIGWIPKNWAYSPINAIKETMVDGPFGSNLKTEHYISDPEVRVIRLQNIQSTKYNDADRAFVSYKHASSLLRNKVVSGDVLIAGLGEERYPVGRACLYPDNTPPAINKADCFRLRCDQSKVLNAYVMYFLNTANARKQLRKFEQGVTRPRINLGNMNRILVPNPAMKEQELVIEKLDQIQNMMDSETERLEKYLKQKAGLMNDLLTGKVCVKAVEPEVAHV